MINKISTWNELKMIGKKELGTDIDLKRSIFFCDAKYYTVEHTIDSSQNRHEVGVFNLRLSKCILIIAFILSTYNIITLLYLEPFGFVVDVYSILPNTFFPLSILCFTIGCFYIFSQSLTIKKFSIILLFTTIISTLIIPYALNYYSMGRGDEMTYIGEYLHIARTGMISGWDIYPASPIIGADISIITGMPINTVSFIIPILFSFLFIIGLYIFGKQIYIHHIYHNILLISSMIFFLGPYHFFNTPHALFFAFIPIYLYTIFNYVLSYNFSFSITAIIFTIFIPFTHPFIFFFIILLLILYIVFHNFIFETEKDNIYRLKNLIIILLSSFLAWFIYSNTLLGSFSISVKSYILKSADSVLNETIQEVGNAGLELPNLIIFILVYYGRYIIPFVIIIFCMLSYHKIILSNDAIKKAVKLLLISLIIATIIEIVLFINPIISHEPDRMTNLMFFVYFLIPLFALSLFVLLNNHQKIYDYIFRIKFIILIAIVVLTFALSIYGALPSPNVCSNNSALTINEINGMNWTYEFRDGNNMCAPLSQLNRFHDLLDDGINDNYIYIPDHFGYDKNTSSFFNNIEYYTGSLYIVIMDCDRTQYEEVPGYISMARYSYRDYSQFTCDTTVDKIYSGMNINISFSY